MTPVSQAPATQPTEQDYYSSSKYLKYKRKQQEKEQKEHEKWLKKTEKHARKMEHERELREMDRKFEQHQREMGINPEPAMLDWPGVAGPGQTTPVRHLTERQRPAFE